METATRATIRWWPAAFLVASVAAAETLVLAVLFPETPDGPYGMGGLMPGAPITVLRWALLVLWTMVVAADERALGPLVLREPLVAAGVGGALIGQPVAGWVVGLLLQSIWPGQQPLGGSRPPMAGCASVLGVLWLTFLPAAAGPWRLPIAMFLAILAAGAGIGAEDRLRARNDRREDVLTCFPAALRGRAVCALVHLGLLESGLAGAAALGALGILPLGLIRGFAGQLAPVPWPAGAGPASPGPVGTGIAGAEGDAALLLAVAAPIALFALGGHVGRLARGWRLWRGSGPATGRPAAAREGSSGLSTELPALGGSPAPPRLPVRRLWALVALQAAFGNRYMQRSGFLYFLHLGPDDGRAARDLETGVLAGGPLNTQPVLAPALLGAVERVVRDARDTPPPRPPQRLLEVGGPRLAQWGDPAIWGALRPGLALVALAGAALWPTAALVYGVLGVALSLIARAALYRWGWERGWDVVKGGTGGRWQKISTWGVRAQVALVALAALAVGAGLGRAGRAAGPELITAAIPFSPGPLSFILGVPLGAMLGRRSLAWAWACVAAGAAALALGGLAG